MICGYFLFVDRKIGYRLKDLRMKCNSLIKDYVSISIPAGLVWHLDAFWIYVFLKNRSDL